MYCNLRHSPQLRARIVHFWQLASTSSRLGAVGSSIGGIGSSAQPAVGQHGMDRSLAADEEASAWRRPTEPYGRSS